MNIKMEKISSRVCLRKDVGLNGYLFGGNMLAWLDETAYIYARESSKKWGVKNLVTKHIGEINFKLPVKEGEIIHFLCSDVTIGKTSLSFEIGAYVESVEVCSTSFTFVNVDNEGHPLAIRFV